MLAPQNSKNFFIGFTVFQAHIYKKHSRMLTRQPVNIFLIATHARACSHIPFAHAHKGTNKQRQTLTFFPQIFALSTLEYQRLLLYTLDFYIDILNRGMRIFFSRKVQCIGKALI